MIPRSEHPKPQFVRESWQNLNGQWDFEIDRENSGYAKEFFKTDKKYSSEITVPFCPESVLSGIGNTDFMACVWYKRKVNIKKDNNIVRLHFGAADYKTTVYVNGKKAGEHTGGFISFFVDITDYVTDGENEICVQCFDDTRSTFVPSGKQSIQYASSGCHYTRTTGIWQTVWLEFIPKTHIESVRYYPNVEDGTVTVRADLKGMGDFSFKADYEGILMGEYTLKNASGEIAFTVKLNEKHLWEIGNGRLYNVEMTFNDDKVTSYFGLRQIRFDGMKFMLNGKSVFLRLVLDQGFYPDGIYTAKTDEILENDILLSQKAGFTGARLHQKIFEERFLYHADRHGYVVWGEYPNWGLDHTNPMSIYSILPEWIDEVKRDFNHPAIIGWCPFNETWDIDGKKQYDDVIYNVYNVTKALDTTRPCIDTSGNFHVKTDVFSLHDYEQEPEEFKKRYSCFNGSEPPFDRTFLMNTAYVNRQKYNGEPFMIAEYGGTAYVTDGTGWGYGSKVNTLEDFIARFKGLTEVIMNNKYTFGLCYTQITDVEQEQNGIYNYDRTEKYDVSLIKEILSQKAAIED